MTIRVNGTEITETAINAEMNRARSAGHPEGEQLRDSAIQELILRNVMIAEAAKLDINAGNEEEIIGTLLQQEVTFDEVDEATCRTFYEENSASFKQGEMAAASHTFFALSLAIKLLNTAENLNMVPALKLATLPKPMPIQNMKIKHCWKFFGNNIRCN